MANEKHGYFEADFFRIFFFFFFRSYKGAVSGNVYGEIGHKCWTVCQAIKRNSMDL